MKTTIAGSSDNNMTQYSMLSEEKLQSLNGRKLSRNRMLMAGVMTTGTGQFSPIKQVLIEHENEDSVIDV